MAKHSQPGRGKNFRSGKGRPERDSSPDSRKSSPSGGKERAARKSGPANRSESSRNSGRTSNRTSSRNPRFGGKDEPRFNKDKPYSGKKSASSATGRRSEDSEQGRKSSGGNRFSKARNYEGKGSSSSDSKRRYSDRDENVKKERGDSRFEKGKKSSPASKSGFAPKRRFNDERERKQPRTGSFSKRKFDTPPSGSVDRPFNSKRGGSRKRKDDTYQAETPTQTEKIRLNRYIANSGVCSRREADELITMGLISVNGKAVTELGYKVNPGDEVRYEGRLLKAERPVYILLNKPKGYLTTTNDPQERNTVMHLIGDRVRERIYPVGRLDRNTTGLLLLTNDGDLADKLMHPSYNVKKIYKVELDRPLTKADFQKIQEGVRLEEGVAQVDDLAIVSEDGKTIGIELHIGWNRVVRRIFESLEYEVVKLDRSVYAGLDKKELSRGQWRFLRQEEVTHLKHFK